MIDLDFTNDIDLVRVNIGDADNQYITDTTIQSALDKYVDKGNKQVVYASWFLMGALYRYFLTLADREEVGDVELEFKNLAERYKLMADEWEQENLYTTRIPILIGGTSLAEKNRVAADLDSFSMYHMQTWHDIELEKEKVLDPCKYPVLDTTF